MLNTLLKKEVFFVKFPILFPILYVIALYSFPNFETEEFELWVKVKIGGFISFFVTFLCWDAKQKLAKLLSVNSIFSKRVLHVFVSKQKCRVKLNSFEKIRNSPFREEGRKMSTNRAFFLTSFAGPAFVQTAKCRPLVGVQGCTAGLPKKRSAGLTMVGPAERFWNRQ